MMRKQYTAAFKARVVQELFKEEKTLAQIAAEYEVHPTQLKNWRAMALEGLPGLFEKQDSTTELKRAHEQQLTELFYGSRKIAAQLQREGMGINRKTVARYMREMGIAAIYPGPNLSKRNQQEGVYPYLLRHITSAYPNHIWGIDITYIRLCAGWMYLVAILDWYSRYVVSWELDQTLELPFVLTAMRRALRQATPYICNSDQGSHFTSPQYLELLLTAKVQISMDGKGRALDNIFTERLWRTVKYEEVNIHDYTSPREARQALTRYFEFYNYERPHQALDYQCPADVYFRKISAGEDAGTMGCSP